MSEIYRYTVETDLGESEPFDTYAEADKIARRDNGKVIEYEYEYSDSHMVADYTNKDEAAFPFTCQTCGAKVIRTIDGWQHLPPYGEHEEPIIVIDSHAEECDLDGDCSCSTPPGTTQAPLSVPRRPLMSHHPQTNLEEYES